jgi:hypothetical protein
MLMKCEQCGRLVDDKPCPYCQSTRVRPLNPGEETENTSAASAATPPPPRPEKIYDPPPRPPRKPAAPGVESPRTPPPPRETPSAASGERSRGPEPVPERPAAAPRPVAPEPKGKEIRGLAEFEALLNVEHFSSVVVCGMSGSGKSEITSGFTRANTYFRGRAQSSMLRSTSGKMYTLGGTVPDEVWFQTINTRRKLVFLDPSGEFFKKISPTERLRIGLPDVTPEHFRFVRSAVAKMAAVILVVDLTNAIDELAASPWLNQEIDLDFTLGALRFFRHDKSPEVENVTLSTLISSRLPRLPRLDVPVLVLFSKADRLGELTNQVPLRFARGRLPRLHSSLRTHARRFRFDFVHTMKAPDEKDLRPEDVDVEAVQVERPCGVLLSMEWLLADPFRWMPKLPTRFLEGL